MLLCLSQSSVRSGQAGYCVLRDMLNPALAFYLRGERPASVRLVISKYSHAL